ncbi:MAG: hypothetical protein M5R38_05435 [Candidatus Methylomirabilis sp.]|nr:hypothetical protein [Candidatus Methylomirabilis sp.]
MSQGDRRVNGGIGGDARKKQDLIGAETQETAEHRIDLLPWPIDDGGQQIVETPLPAEDAVRQFSRQRPVLWRKTGLVELCVQQQAGVCPLFLYPGQYLVRKPPCVEWRGR